MITELNIFVGREISARVC